MNKEDLELVLKAVSQQVDLYHEQGLEATVELYDAHAVLVAACLDADRVAEGYEELTLAEYVKVRTQPKH